MDRKRAGVSLWLALAAASAWADSPADGVPGDFRDAAGSKPLFSASEHDNGALLEEPAGGRPPDRAPFSGWEIFWVCLAGAGAWAAAASLKKRRDAPRFSSGRWNGSGQVRSFPGTEPLAGKYTAVRLLGRGAAGEVWQARDQTLGRTVTVKTLWPDPGAERWAPREQRRAEARAAATLHHPNIGDVYEIVEVPSSLYLISEFIPGWSLRSVLQKNRRLPLARTVPIFRGVCRALAHAHASGIAHKGLRPSNVFLTSQGHVKVIDFGLSPREAGGPFSYAPPEDPDGTGPFAADLYSLGACLFELLTGSHPCAPYSGSRIDGRRFPKPSALVCELPPAIDELIDRAMDPNPSARPAGIQEFLARLELCYRGSSASAKEGSSSAAGSSGRAAAAGPGASGGR